MKKKLFPTSGHQAAYDVLKENGIHTTKERKKERGSWAKEPTKQSVNETRRNAAPSNTTCTSQIKDKKNLKGKKSNQMRKKKGDDEKKWRHKKWASWILEFGRDSNSTHFFFIQLTRRVCLFAWNYRAQEDVIDNKTSSSLKRMSQLTSDQCACEP